MKRDADLLKFVSGAEKAIAVALLLVILILTFAQVVARFVFSSPFFWTGESSRYAYVWLSFVASAFVMHERGHITVEIMDQRMPPVVRIILNSIAHVAVLTVCLLMVGGSSGMVFSSHGGASPALGIPTVVFYGVVYVCFGLMGIHTAINWWTDIVRYRTGAVVTNVGDNVESAL